MVYTYLYLFVLLYVKESLMSYKIKVLQALYQLIADYGLFEDEDVEVFLTNTYDEICHESEAEKIMLEMPHRTFFIELHQD